MRTQKFKMSPATFFFNFVQETLVLFFSIETSAAALVRAFWHSPSSLTC